MFIATLIAAERLSSGDISAAEDRLREAGISPMARSWVEEDEACDLLFSGSRNEARTVLDGQLGAIDVIIQGESARHRKLLAADMDSTIIAIECIDELADFAGARAEVAAITERAMAGELDFAEALRARVALLAGQDEDILRRCEEERVILTPGAETLVRTMRARGAYCLLVSGGFAAIADKVAARVGFHRAVANTLGVKDGALDGKLVGAIVGADSKRQALLDAAAERELDLADTLAVGDGANDIPMLEAAGLGVAYHAKPAVDEAAAARLRHNDLSALLFAQGYARAEWEV